MNFIAWFKFYETFLMAINFMSIKCTWFNKCKQSPPDNPIYPT